MKKYVAFAGLVFAGSVFARAAGEELTLSSPAGGSLSSGNAYIAWDGNEDWLTSWEISFSLTDAEVGNAALFSTTRQNSGGATGYVLSTREDGSLALTSTADSSFSLTTSASLVTAGTKLEGITLSFVSDKNELTGAIESGTFTLSAGGESTSALVLLRTEESDPSILATNGRTLLFNGEKLIDGTTWSSRFWTNGGAEVLSDISLTRLNDRSVIPEYSSFAFLAAFGAFMLVTTQRKRARARARAV